MNSAPAKIGSPRRMSAPLLIAIIAVPALFGWFLLRRGYARSTRLAVLSYAATITMIGILAGPPA